MDTFKRVVAVFIAILAIVGVLLMVGAIAGTWILNDQVTDLTLNLLDRVDMAIDQVTRVLDQIDGRLMRVEDRIEGVETAVLTIGGVLEENSIIVTLISSLLDVDLGNGLEQAGQTVDSVQSAAESIDNTIQTIDALPFVNLLESRPRLDAFGEIADGIEELQADVADSREEVQQRRSEIVNGAVSSVMERTGRMLGRVDNLQGALANIDAQFGALQERINEIRETFPRTLDLLTFLANLVILVGALAFLSLLAHSIALFKRPDQSFGELVGWPDGGDENEEEDSTEEADDSD